MKPCRLSGCVCVLVLLSSLVLAVSVHAAPTIFKNGLTRLDAANVYPGYVVYVATDGVIYVIATEGTLARKWNAPAGGTFSYARPLDNGNILTRLHDVDGNRSIIEIDQSRNKVWEFEQPPGFTFHHDHSRLSNGNTLILCAQEILVPAISSEMLEDDCLMEVTPGGTIVWQWQTADHFDDFQFTDQWQQAIADHAGDWAHANSAHAIPDDTSHLDPRFQPGNIVVSYRHLNSVIIIDRVSGDIVWRTDGLTIGQHDPEMLPDSLPGGGNILVFDNGLGGRYNFGGTEVWRAHSRIVEIDPTDFSIAYEYKARNSGFPDFMFNSFFISSAQRLPNGSTFIDEGAFGRFFEVMADGTMVWEFVSPVTGTFQGQPSTRVYRAEKVPLDWLQ